MGKDSRASYCHETLVGLWQFNKEISVGFTIISNKSLFLFHLSKRLKVLHPL